MRELRRAREGLLLDRLVDEDELKAPFERRVGLYEATVLLDGRGAYYLHLPRGLGRV